MHDLEGVKSYVVSSLPPIKDEYTDYLIDRSHAIGLSKAGNWDTGRKNYSTLISYAT